MDFQGSTSDRHKGKGTDRPAGRDSDDRKGGNRMKLRRIRRISICIVLTVALVMSGGTSLWAAAAARTPQEGQAGITEQAAPAPQASQEQDGQGEPEAPADEEQAAVEEQAADEGQEAPSAQVIKNDPAAVKTAEEQAEAADPQEKEEEKAEKAAEGRKITLDSEPGNFTGDKSWNYTRVITLTPDGRLPSEDKIPVPVYGGYRLTGYRRDVRQMPDQHPFAGIYIQ